jgi:hypothetical protein
MSSSHMGETMEAMGAKISEKMSAGKGPIIQLEAILTALRDAFMTLPLMKKLMLLIWMLIIIPLYNLNMFLFSRFLNREKNKNLKKIDENIWVTSGSFFALFPLYSSNMMVVKGKDGTVLIYNPIELQMHTLQQIQEIGPVKAIFVPHYFHDWWLADWKARFPHVSIYTIRNMKPNLERSIHVDNILEDDPDMCENYGILQINDITAMMRPGVSDYFLAMETASKRRLAVLPHVASTEGASLKYWAGWLLGYSGMGYPKINRLVYVRDPVGLKDYSVYLFETKRPNILFALHGKVLDNEREIQRWMNALKKTC